MIFYLCLSVEVGRVLELGFDFDSFVVKLSKLVAFALGISF